MKSDLVRAAVLALVMAGASALAVKLTPHTYIADQFPRQKLAEIVPQSFGEWEIDRSLVPLMPSPDLQEVIDATYDESLALTYRNRAGRRVMLSLAYGRNQHKGMSAHRPEVCYPAQGFRLKGSSMPVTLHFGQREIGATRVLASMGARNEPITYWLLVGDEITHFGYPQRLVAVSYGVRGLIPDGVLVRVSSIEWDSSAAFASQEQFIKDLLLAVRADQLARLIGMR